MFLAIDTVFDQCSVALVRPDMQIIYCDVQAGKREQAQQILPMIDTALAHAGITLTELTVLVFNRGPGPFSGIRINTAVAQALSVAQDLPCVGVSSLKVLAQAGCEAHGLSHVYAALDARMNQVYFGEFCMATDDINPHQLISLAPHSTESLIEYGAQTQDALPIVGNGASLLSAKEDQRVVDDVKPDASVLAKLGIVEYQRTGGVSAEQALPVYLRNDAWKTLKEQGKA